MLTAIIRADASASALAATLSVLIPAVADGFLGHAVVVAAGADREIETIADATGADYLVAGDSEAWRLGANQARGDWLVLLDAGDVPQAHWVQTVDRHLMLGAGRPALIPLRGAVDALVERGAVATAPRRMRAGLILPKSQAVAGLLAAPPRRLACRRERAG